MNGQSGTYRPLVISTTWDIALNAGIPVACFYAWKLYVSPSELSALLAATIFPTLKSVFDVSRRGELNPVAILVLLGVVVSIAALFVSDDPRMLLVRESVVTGAFGAACLFSLLLSRPMMFYFGRYFMAGTDPQRRKTFEERWQVPSLRQGHRLITTVWGFVFLGEFAARVVLIYTMPVAVVLIISPALLGIVTLSTAVWTYRYAFRLRDSLVAAESAQSVPEGVEEQKARPKLA